MTHGPDYDLIDRLMLKSEREQDEYILKCPHLDQVMEFRNELVAYHKWYELPVGSYRGELRRKDGTWHAVYGLISGEIQSST